MSDNTVVTENTVTNIVEVTSAGPAGPPGGAITIQDQGVSEGLLTDKLNFTGSTVSVNNDTVNEIATVTINAATPGANANITSMTGITGGISSPDFIQFDTAAGATGAVGRMLWNDTDGTLEFQMKGGNVTLQVGQEEVLRVTNQSGSTMTDGQVVYITGSTGNHLNVTLSQANSEATSSKTLAVVTESIANNQSGFATTSGLVRNLNTSALTEGAAIWLSPTVAGGLTSTKPVAPNHAVLIGWCVRQHASAGVIYVHIANGYELEELHNVLITSAANNQVLRYDSATSLWKNTTISPTVTLAGAVTGSGTLTDLGNVTITTTATSDPTLTLSGDASGTATFTNLGDATLAVTVADNSHNHTIANVTGLQADLDLKAPLASPTFTGSVTLPTTTAIGTVSSTEIGYLDGVTSAIQTQIDTKLASASYTAADVLTKIKTVDGVGSGLDADLLDGESGAYYLDFTNATNKPNPTITLSGDATGSVTLTDLASGTLNVTVADDSHNHIISNVDGLQDALDAKLPSASYTAADVLTKIKTVDGAGSGLDADLLDGESSAYYTAINDRLGYTAENAANKGVAGGYASLDGAGLVPSTQLPSYVDDVLEYANTAAFPVTGESGKIYVAIDTAKTYRWAGSVYVEISASPGTTDALTEGSVNLYFTQARARASLSAGTGISYSTSTGVITNSAPDQTVALTGSGTTSISGTYPNFTVSSADQYVGTVTSVAALTLGTTGTDLSSSVANGTTTPVITLNVPTASASNRGALSSTDWSTFNGKQAALVSGTNIKTVNGTTLLGSGDLGTIGVPYGGTGVTTSTGTGSVVLSNSPTLVTPTLGAASATSIAAALGAVGTPSYTFTGDTNTGIYSPGADTLAFVEGGVEAMRIDSSGNVGIGTSSPSSYGKLTVNGSVILGAPSGRNTAATNYIGTWTTGDPADDARANIGFTTVAGAASSSSYITFATNNYGVSGGERMRIDSSGNVGIGTSSPGKTLDLVGQFRASGSAGSGYALLEYGTSGTASNNWHVGSEGDGTFRWYNGNLGGGTERMRITSAGNVGIGVSSPKTRLQTSAGTQLNAPVLGNASNAPFYVTNNDPNYGLVVGTSASDGHVWLQAQRTDTATAYNITLNEAGGNVGIGTSSPVDKLNVSDGTATFLFKPLGGSSIGYMGMRTNHALGFATNDTERMRIDTSGNVGIGTTAPSFQLQLSTDSAAKPTTNLWTIASDSRIKTETGEYTKGLDAVCALRPITYRYNGTAGFVDDGKENISIIAQEAMQHFPECVGTFEALLNEGDEEKTELLNWNGHALIFALVNAVKELKAVNDALSARVAQLEGN